MKILFLQNVLFDYRVEFYNLMTKRGFDVTVVHSGEFNNQKTLFKQLIVPKKSIGFIIFQYKLPNFDQFDAVISMFDLHWLSNIYPVILNRKYKFYFWGHGFGKNQLGNQLRKWLIEKSDGLILYNATNMQKIVESGVTREKLYVANNTLAVSNAGRHEGKRSQFIFVGRLQQRKRVDLFIKAFALAVKATKKEPNNSIAIIGDGEERSLLENLSRSLGIEKHCHFLGKINDDDKLKEQFDKSIAYVSPGPMGLGVNHSFAYGVPTLSNKAYKHGPETWVLNSSNSLWINATDEQEQIKLFAQEMIFLLENPLQAEQMGKQAYCDYVEKCSIDVMLNGFCEALGQD